VEKEVGEETMTEVVVETEDAAVIFKTYSRL
jgi:hypothetical protein